VNAIHVVVAWVIGYGRRKFSADYNIICRVCS